MNGTALRKPINWRVVGMVAGNVIIALALRDQRPTRQRPISALEYVAGGAARHLAGHPEPVHEHPVFPAEFWFGQGGTSAFGTSVNGASASGTSSRRSMTPFTPTSRRAIAGGAVGVVIAAVLVTALALRLARPRPSALRPTITFPRSAGPLATLPVLRCIFTDAPEAPCCVAAAVVGLGTLIPVLALGPSSSSSIGRSPRRCCNTNRTPEETRGVKSYAAGVFFIAAVKQKMK